MNLPANLNNLPAEVRARIAAAQGTCSNSVQPLPMAGMPNFIKWAPSLGDCPSDLSRLLCWLFRGYCSFNRFGKIGTSRLVTNSVDLPDAVGGFNIGPEGEAVSMGCFFPRDWVGEACM